MKKTLLIIGAIILLVIASVAAYLKLALPNVGKAENLHVDTSPQRVAHGEYLANHVTLCMDCHSTREWNKLSGPPDMHTLGKGGEKFNQQMGFPGIFYSKNITPFHLKDWTDGEIFRAITTGVNKNGEALFPVMPYLNYGRMDKEDIYDVIAYIRSLPSIENTPSARNIDFPMNFIINTIPNKAQLTTKPLPTDTIAYGAYVVNAAACIECHTPVKRGQIIKEKAFTGGREFMMPNGILRSANITPDEETGIGNWTAEQFIQRFKSYADIDKSGPLPGDKVNTIMPWKMFSGMDTSDLLAIYKYIRTLTPVRNNVVHEELYATKK